MDQTPAAQFLPSLIKVRGGSRGCYIVRPGVQGSGWQDHECPCAGIEHGNGIPRAFQLPRNSPPNGRKLAKAFSWGSELGVGLCGSVPLSFQRRPCGQNVYLGPDLPIQCTARATMTAVQTLETICLSASIFERNKSIIPPTHASLREPNRVHTVPDIFQLAPAIPFGVWVTSRPNGDDFLHGSPVGHLEGGDKGVKPQSRFPTFWAGRHSTNNNIDK